MIHLDYLLAFLPKLLFGCQYIRCENAAIVTYLWKNWLNMPPFACWSVILARRAALASEPRFCSWRPAKAGMKPELCECVSGRVMEGRSWRGTYSATAAGVASRSNLGSTGVHDDCC